MRPILIVAVVLAVSLSGVSTDVTWGPGPVTVSGTSDPAIALLAVHAQTEVTWFEGSQLFQRDAPTTMYLYGFHQGDAPTSVDTGRLGTVLRSFTTPVGGSFQTDEQEYDLDGDGRYMPHERVYRLAIGNTFTDPDYGNTNAALAVDAQRPDEVWIDEVDIYQTDTTAADLGFTDLGFEGGSGTTFAAAWTPGNDLEPPEPVRDTDTPYAGTAHALLPISNAPTSGDRPTIQQTVTGIPDKTLEKDVTLHVTFWAKAPTTAECGAHLRTWDAAVLKDDLEAQASVTATWSQLDLTFDISEKSDDIEMTLFCERPVGFTDVASAPFRLFLEPA